MGSFVFDRVYTLVSFSWEYDDPSTCITAAVRALDADRMPASVACMTTDQEYVHVLIEHWRERAEEPAANGHSQQTPEGSMDRHAAPRKPRRPRASAHHHTGAAKGDQPTGVAEPVDACAAGEIDLVLPDGAIEWP